ncbi:MAG: FecR domain-containing protein [Acidobacteria bacterium]|nr:FecR domain-containing protein [Acidobacteriota bacterium]
MRFKCFAIGIAILFAGAPAFPNPLPQDDAPYLVNAGVARVSLIKGEVTFQRGATEDWEAAAINLPLDEGDRITTGPDGRAEIQLYSDNYVRVSHATQLSLGRMTTGDARFSVESGTVTVRANRIDDDVRIQVDTPSCQITVNKKGVYRINVSEAGDTELVVRKGLAEVSWASGVLEVKSGRALHIGAQDPSNYAITRDIASDDWDRWCEDRDEHLTARLTTARYVSPTIWGASDLDYYGGWQYVSSYGYCWFPTVSYGWAPFRAGRWIWGYPWGWTWVSYEPWGWAPYHFGSWFYTAGFGWGWYPGGFGHRHYYHPGRVTFVSFRGHGGNYVGWIPWSREGGAVGTPGLPTGKDRFAGLTLESEADVAKLPKEVQRGISVMPESDFVKGGGKPLEYAGELKGNLKLETAHFVPQKSLSTELVPPKFASQPGNPGNPSKVRSMESIGSGKGAKSSPMEVNKLGEMQRANRVEKGGSSVGTAQDQGLTRDPGSRKADRQLQSVPESPRTAQPATQARPEAKQAPMSEARPETRSSPPVRETRPEPRYAPPARETRPEPRYAPPAREMQPAPRIAPPAREVRPAPRTASPSGGGSARGFQPRSSYPYGYDSGSMRNRRSASPDGPRVYDRGSDRGFATRPSSGRSRIERGGAFSSSSPRYSAPSPRGGRAYSMPSSRTSAPTARGSGFSMPSPRYSAPSSRGGGGISAPSSRGGGGFSAQPSRRGKG